MPFQIVGIRDRLPVGPRRRRERFGARFNDRSEHVANYVARLTDARGFDVVVRSGWRCGVGRNGAAKREALPNVEHRASRYLNNVAENSHRPSRRTERPMQRFKSLRQAQDFLFAHSFIYGSFRPRRHRLAATSYRVARAAAFHVWKHETCVRMTA